MCFPSCQMCGAVGRPTWMRRRDNVDDSVVGKKYTEKELRKLRADFKRKMRRGKRDKISKDTGLLRSASSGDEVVDIVEVLRSATHETIEVRGACAAPEGAG